ncbi:MAG: ABC transporter permease subunit [Planctomycetes bacterium]|jgi:ABC-2 type transport system permease protein|nr:ABC transporter permease subunit [Phycisphaerae bacterium]NBB95579.1 ABC transporter permease subunit [Planctomycetota bacterium]
MGKIWTLARRELAGTFFSPLAWVVGALFLCACAFKFCPPPAFWSGSRDAFILVPHQQASLRGLFEMMGVAMVVAAPLLTMRLVAEEVRSGTVETLVTAPITDAQIILGKFAGVMGFYMALLASTVVFLVLMLIFATPDAGVVIMGYLGMLLLGAAFLAAGLFASTLTRYQLLAAVIGIGVVSLLGIFPGRLAPHLPAPLNQVAANLNAQAYLRDFARGMFDSRGLIYFLSLTAGFLFLSVKMLESKRWR